MNIHEKSRYHETHARSLKDPEGFWAEAAREIDWIEPAKKIFDPAMGIYGRWFAGAVVNTCYNALDRHVAGGRADQIALIHDSPLTNSITRFTYAELLAEVKTLAAIMQDFGVAKGDRVILYMPMVPEAVVAMLACARIGAVHSVVFGGFAAKELATRIDDAKVLHDGGERLHLMQQLCIGELRDAVGERGIVDQCHLIGAAAGDMAIERVVAGIDHAAGEPAAIGSGRRIEHLLRRLDPVDLPRRLGPKPLRVGERARVDLVIAAFVVNVHGLAPSDVPQAQKT